MNLLSSSFPVLIVLSLAAAPVFAADDVVIAESEDLREFDELLSRSKRPDARPSGERAAEAEFGQSVSEEARKLKDADLETRQAFGKSVAERRRRDGSRLSGRPEGLPTPEVLRERVPGVERPGGVPSGIPRPQAPSLPIDN